MKKSLKRAAAFLLTAAMAVSLAGCGEKKQTEIQGSSEGFPETVSVFTKKRGTIIGDMKDYNDIYAYQLLEEATGTHIDWVLPMSSAFGEKFNMMIASGEYPDVIHTTWDDKGVVQYINDGVVFDMAPYVEEHMPNLWNFLKEHPDIARAVMYDGGKVHTAPSLQKDNRTAVYIGPVMRTDWLEKLNLEVPTNAEELYNVLKAFKTQDPNGNGQADEIPMSVVGTKSDTGLAALMHMFGTKLGFYVKDGEVKYGILEPEFKEALEYIVKLYSEGLVDGDYILQDRTNLLGKITNNQVGFSFEYQPTQVMTTMAESDPSFKFEGIPHFKDSNGVRRSMIESYSQLYGGSSSAITTNCKDPLAVMRWMDFIYSEEGHKIVNFGKEGDTYTVVDGQIKYADKIENNTEGLTRSQVWGKYFATYTPAFIGIQDWDCYGQYLSKEGRAAVETWTTDTLTDRNLPSLIFEDADRENLSKIFAPIETYVDEQVVKIILGQEKIDKIDSVCKEIKSRGIDDVLEIYQRTYDAYMNKDLGF